MDHPKTASTGEQVAQVVVALHVVPLFYTLEHRTHRCLTCASQTTSSNMLVTRRIHDRPGQLRQTRPMTAQEPFYADVPLHKVEIDQPTLFCTTCIDQQARAPVPTFARPTIARSNVLNTPATSTSASTSTKKKPTKSLEELIDV